MTRRRFRLRLGQLDLDRVLDLSRRCAQAVDPIDERLMAEIVDLAYRQAKRRRSVRQERAAWLDMRRGR